MMKELFVTENVHACEITENDNSALQEFFDANPEYFLAVNGMPPRDDEAWQEFNDRPPVGMPYERQIMIGFVDQQNQLVAMASVLANFIANGVWHIGLFIVATRLHGSSAAASIYQALEHWMQRDGAQWIRLGVVLGNRRAERFWQKNGYTELRQRMGIQTGNLISTVRVLMKSLCGGSPESYLLLVERDRPDSPSAASPQQVG